MTMSTVTLQRQIPECQVKNGRNGELVDAKSPWRFSIIPELFWALINFIVLFFQTLISPSKTGRGSQYTSDYRPGGGPPQPPRRRMGGFQRGQGGPAAPPMGGG